MIDPVERPDLVHAAVERLVDAWRTELDQFVEMNLLALGWNNTRIGSGAYGHTNALPEPNFDPGSVKPHNVWGCSAPNADRASGARTQEPRACESQFACGGELVRE